MLRSMEFMFKYVYRGLGLVYGLMTPKSSANSLAISHPELLAKSALVQAFWLHCFGDSELHVPINWYISTLPLVLADTG